MYEHKSGRIIKTTGPGGMGAGSDSGSESFILSLAGRFFRLSSDQEWFGSPGGYIEID